MKLKTFGMIMGLAFLSMAETTLAQGTLEIDGTGSGTLNGVSFSDESFVWTLNYSTSGAYSFGADSLVYDVSSSQLVLAGAPLTVSVTGANSASGLWLDWSSTDLILGPMFGNPGANILSVYPNGGWDGVSAYSSTSIANSSFNQFVNLATDGGALTMSSGSVSEVSIAGVSAVPEPSTVALSAVGGIGALWRVRRRK